MKKIIPLCMVLALASCKTKNAVTTTDRNGTTVTTNVSKAFFPEGSVTKKFKTDFPNARQIVWKESDLRYHVNFFNNGYHSQATYSKDGVLLDNMVGMDVNKLPLTSKNYLNTKYPNNVVESAYKMREGYKDAGKIFVKLKGSDDVIFDNAGNFLSYKTN